MTQYYSSKLATIILATLAIIYGLATFGNPLLFDRIYIIIIIGTAYILRKNHDVLGIMIILAVSHLMQDLVHYWTQEDNVYLVKILVYCCVLFTIYQLWYDSLNKLALAITATAISAEIYWVVTAYSAPNIFWFVFLTNQSLILRHLLLCRTAYYRQYLQVKGQPTVLDYCIEKACKWFVIIDTLMILEYLARHIFNAEILIIYKSFPYVVQAIGVYIIWLVLREYQYLIEEKYIKA